MEGNEKRMMMRRRMVMVMEWRLWIGIAAVVDAVVVVAVVVVVKHIWKWHAGIVAGCWKSFPPLSLLLLLRLLARILTKRWRRPGRKVEENKLLEWGWTVITMTMMRMRMTRR
jgi:H+/Cl- antiporter ClcA